MRRRLALVHWFGAALLLTVLTACGDSGGGGGDGDLGGNGNGSGDATTDTDDPDGTPGPGGVDGQPVAIAREIIILHDQTVPLGLGIQEELVLRAKVIDYEVGAPAAELAVNWEVIENIGQNGATGDGSLAAKQVYTAADGLTENVFRGGLLGEIKYTVRLSAEGADDRFIELYVSDSPTGSIEVNFLYSGPIPLNTIKLRLMPKGYSCGEFLPTGSFSGALFEKTVLSVSDKPVFDLLAANTHFTVIATAKSPTGALAAAGCRDGVFVVAKTKSPVSLELNVLPLIPTGTYDVDNIFDFSSALGALGTVGEVISGIQTLFNNPGKFLIDQIKVLVAGFIGEFITDAAFGLFEDELADIITDWVKDDSPQWLQDFFTIGDDLTQIVDRLHLKSTLKISKLEGSSFQGTQFWTGIVLTWKYGCDPAAPDYETCGVTTYSMADLANTEFPQNVVEGFFVGQIANYDRLSIDKHSIQISYGKLILFVLNEIILKTITGTNNLKDAVLQFVDCPNIASLFSNGVLDALGLTEDKLSGFCTSTITLLIIPLENYVKNLALDSQLRLSGSCTLVDETEDLYVDRLADGEYVGQIEIDQGAGPSFSGTFSGTKAAPIQ
ncbi:MAG: hypothetical protein IV100_15505 [Myxococcales bacterium]|nr:hypothetical protein [Myxococcales bacterium]